MGKVSRSRTKYHTPGKNASSAKKEPESQASLPLKINNVPDNLFAGLDIPLEYLEPNKTLQDNLKKEARDNEDARSTFSSFSSYSKKSFKSDSMRSSKKDMRARRREAFLAKLNTVHAAEIERKKREKRQKTVVTGDLQPLLDALDSTQRTPKRETNRQVKERSVPKLNSWTRIHNERMEKCKNVFMDFLSPK